MAWPNENAFDYIIWPAAKAANLSPYLVKGIIAQESQFKPTARRREAPRDTLPPTPDFPNGGDESRGLMQILLRTARALGYQGDLAGMDDPALNIAYGIRLLSDNLKRTRSGVLKNDSAARQLDAAIAAYNAGWSKQRAGDAPRTGATTATPFVNQAYVDRVRANERYFEAQGGPAPRPGSSSPAPSSNSSSSSSSPVPPAKPGAAAPPLPPGCGPTAVALTLALLSSIAGACAAAVS